MNRLIVLIFSCTVALAVGLPGPPRSARAQGEPESSRAYAIYQCRGMPVDEFERLLRDLLPEGQDHQMFTDPETNRLCLRIAVQSPDCRTAVAENRYRPGGF